MIAVDLRSLTQPVGVVRLMATVFTCVSFSLVASAGTHPSPYWAWCMFTWCFCFSFTLLILALEFTSVHAKLPFAWDDFTTAFAMLASLMCLSVSVMYPVFFTCKACPRQIGASVVSWVCFGLYAAEAVLTRLRPSGQNSGFLSSPPGVMKMVEAFLACLIFTSLEKGQYAGSPELQWCVAVYCLCFIFAILIILLSAGRLASFFPVPFDKVVIVYNILAAVMYLTATVMWPLYSLRGNKRPSNCGHLCAWDKLVVVTFMTILNVIVYSLDTAYSIRLVFCARAQ